MRSVNFHTKVDLFTKFVSGILVLLSAARFLAHAFREYGLSFTSNHANTPNTLSHPPTLTKTVNEVSL